MDPTTSRHRREGAFDLSTEESLQHSGDAPPKNAENSHVLESLGPPVFQRNMQKLGARAVMDLHNSNRSAMVPSAEANPGQSSQNDFLQLNTLAAKDREIEGVPAIRQARGTPSPGVAGATRTPVSMIRNLSQDSDSGPAYSRLEHGRVATEPQSSASSLGKPRANIQERSSSHGATIASSQAGSILRTPSTAHEKGHLGTYRSTKSSKDDGFKTIRSRAKGMFSRMFTNSKNGQVQVPPSTTVPREASRIPLTSSTSRTPDPGGLGLATTSVDRPTLSEADFTLQPDSIKPASSSGQESPNGISRSPYDNSQSPSVPSTLPLSTRSRTRPTTIPGRGSSMSAASSIPPAVEEKQRPDLVQIKSLSGGTVRSGTISKHVREGALSQVDSEDPSEGVTAPSKAAPDSLLTGPAPDIDSSPERFKQWRQTMEGLLDGQRIEEDLHRELGLSPASLSISAKPDNGRPPTAAKIFPADLGRGRSLRRTATDGSNNSSHRATASTDTGLPETDARIPRSAALQVPANTVPISRDLSQNAPGMTGNEDTKVSNVSSRESLDVGPPSTNTEELELQGKILAAEMFDGDETHVKKEQVAKYIGGRKPLSTYALKHYLAHFDFTNLRLDDAFRALCGKLYLKAETQEIDRILEAFSERYFACNPTNIFGGSDIIHTVTGSFLLLNTDLHIADISTHMSRSQFVRLTLQTINANSETISPMSSAADLHRRSSMSAFGNSRQEGATVPDGSRLLPLSMGNNSVDELAGPRASEPRNHITSSVSMGSIMSTRGRDSDLEAALREIYASVKSNQILLPVAMPFRASSKERGNSIQLDRRRTSFRGVSGIFQPVLEESTGDGESIQAASGAGMPTLGFVSNLAHTAIKEQEIEIASLRSNRTMGSEDDLTDDQLALMGAPWAKEGNLSRKLFWDGAKKRNKDKNWKQVFTVLQKGEIHMFVFGEGSQVQPGNPVGGGNWMANARGTGDLNLSHTIASALAPPGYNAARPYCFSLTFPSGEMSLFQAGTEDLTQEWVSTCNYWAARRTRPPLPGGVTNAEYGWRSLESPREEKDDAVSVFSNKSSKSRLSFQNTIGRRNNSLMPIVDWQAPQPSLVPSPLDEEAQLESLQRHLKILNRDFKQHQSFEESLDRLYPPRSSSLLKAKENWRNRSNYITAEIDKYKIYIDSLRQAIALRVEKQGEKKLHQSLQFGSDYEDDDYDEDLYEEE